MKEIELVIPEWAHWYAEDIDGASYLYAVKPNLARYKKNINHQIWSRDAGKDKCIAYLDYNWNWKESLTQVQPGNTIYLS